MPAKTYFYQCGCVSDKTLIVKTGKGSNSFRCPKCYDQSKSPSADVNKAVGLERIEATCNKCGVDIEIPKSGLVGLTRCLCKKCRADKKKAYAAKKKLEERALGRAFKGELDRDGLPMVTGKTPKRKAKCPRCETLHMVPGNRKYSTQLPRVYCESCAGARQFPEPNFGTVAGVAV